MGAPLQSLLDSLSMKGMVLENKGSQTTTSTTTILRKTTSSNYNNVNNNVLLWSNVLEAQRAKLRQTRRKQIHHLRKSKKRVLMKRRRNTHQQGLRRSENGIETRVQTLERLIPDRESQGLDGLFRDTATYIMSLQMRVRVMQVMVDVLGGSSQEHH